MTASRDRKEASKRLGLAFQKKYRTLLEAVSEEDIQTAAIDLGACFNTNIEFVIAVLKAYGGMEVRFEKRPHHDPLPVLNMPE